MEAVRNLISQVIDQYTLVTTLTEDNWLRWSEIELLNLAAELDESGLTMFMLTRGLYDEFLQTTKFTAKSVLDDPKSFFTKLDAMRKLYDLTEDAEVVTLIREFESKILGAADSYGVTSENREKLVGMMADKYLTAEIRLAALRAMKNLEVCQFLAGIPSPKPLRINQFVFEFWNVNSLIAAMRSQKVDGVSLCLIRDPQQVMASYFVFAVRNGENLYILTDRQEGPHPRFWQMTRKPDRDMCKRWQANWFPYHLLDLKPDTDAEGAVKGYHAAKRNGLVHYQAEAVRLAPISELPPTYFMWVSLMFDRIQEHYSKTVTMLPDLAYTGEMVMEPEVLADKGSSLVLSGYYRPLELAPLTKADVSSEATASQWETVPTSTNNWIEDRYGKNVPDEILCPVGKDAQHRLSSGSGLLTEKRFSHQEQKPLLESLSPVTYGTEEKLKKDRQWVGRYNLMVHIQKQLDDEFKREKGNVFKWFKARVQERRSVLIDAAVRGEFMSVVRRRTSDNFWDTNCLPIECNILNEHRSIYNSAVTLGGRWTGKAWTCCINGRPGSIVRRFWCNNGQAIADVLGLKLEELPISLQHYLWHHDYPYKGNSILGRLDPLDWNIANPWDKEGYDIAVVLSKSGINQRRKELRLPRAK
jgi:hypothetical protein